MFDTYAEIFTERANSYRSAMDRWPGAREAEFRAVLAPLADAPDGLVCDMPSGGCYLRPYLRPGMRYLAIEPVDDFLDVASGGSVERLSAPIVDVPLPDGSVDYVVSLAGLHHEPDLARVFDEMRRLLKADGRLVIADVETGTAPARFLNGFVARNNPLGHEGRFLDSGTCATLSASGFAILEDALVEVPWAFDSVADGAAFCSELFGIAESGRHATAAMLAHEIGFYNGGPHVHLRWMLRRIVARAS